MKKPMKPGSLMSSQGKTASSMMGRMLKATHKMQPIRKKLSLEGGTSTGGKPVNPATVKNPAWVAQGAAKPAGPAPKVTVGGATPWVNNATGKALKSAKRKKASKPEMAMAYKKGKAKKKASK